MARPTGMAPRFEPYLIERQSMTEKKPDTLHMAIVGAGPVGLEAALAAAEAGLSFTLYEAGAHVGHNVISWGHVGMFTGWDLTVSPRMRRWLERAGHAIPSGDALPTGHQVVSQVLQPVAELPEVASRLRLGTRVLSVAREGLLKHEEIASRERAALPFRLLLRDSNGSERIDRADMVVDCTGTYDVPNALGEGGIPAPGEAAVQDRITRHIPDVDGNPREWAGKRILLVGGGHSAQAVAQSLAAVARRDPGTRVVWALRHPELRLEPLADDRLPARSRLTRAARELVNGDTPGLETLMGASVNAVESNGDGVNVFLLRRDGSTAMRQVDRIVSMCGYVGDHGLYRQLQVHECYATAAPMKLSAALLAGSTSSDCMDQKGFGASTLENPEPGFLILGSKSYGRNNTFLLRVGWEQVDEVFGPLGAQVTPACAS